VSGGDGDDVINTRTDPGTGLPDVGYGTPDNPLYYPGDPAPLNDRDTVDGGAGNDTILTGDDNDLIFGGDGDDSIDAGFDDDLVYGDAGHDTIEGNEGNDTIFGGDGDDLIYGDVSPDNPDYVVFAPYDLPNDGTDLAPNNNGDSLSGGAGNDTIFGQDDNDTIDGGDGNDSLDGGHDDDLITGGAGDDTLVGGDGNDTLNAGPGNDTVTGGAGNDTFIYTVGDGLLTITDFNTGNTGTLDDGDATNNDFIDLSGFYNNIAELQDDYADDGILNQSNNGNTVWGQTVDYSDNTQFAPGDGIIVQGATADGNSFTQENTGVICFTPGTLILTETGPRPVESLRAGDRIVTRDNGVQPLQWVASRWIGAAELQANERLRPVLIRPDLIGADAPLLVSPQHGVLLRSDGGEERLVRAVHLTRRPGSFARVADGLRQVTYIHLMFDAHQIVFANGAASESFYPGPMALAALSAPARRELTLIFPELFTSPTDRAFGPRARPFARARDLPPSLRDLRAA
jgi:hypothetical protein